MVSRHVPDGEPTTSRRGSFWVGTEPVGAPGGSLARGPMYVAWEAPAQDPPQPRPPWVLVHGGGGQGTDYLTTPDGRPGWARLLVAQGHTVYVVDRPGHGRSPHHPDVLGAMAPPMGAQALRSIFVPPPDGPDANPWSALHTQWPGGREPGDPVYDQWLAPSGPMLADWAQMHALERDRLGELLDMVGPAIVVTHSAGGPGTFAAVDAHPDGVAALIAIETVGPPFSEDRFQLPWGVSAAPLTYDPPAADPSQLRLRTVELEGSPVPLTLQADPPRRLPNLTRFPIAVVTAEASLFRLFDRHLVAFLEQAGCDAELIQLADHGVHGNGHGMMLERNHADVLAVLTGWAAARATAISSPPAPTA